MLDFFLSTFSTFLTHFDDVFTVIALSVAVCATCVTKKILSGSEYK